jgi:methionine synthase II (cobalamin-independent)/thioredoxin reductase
MPLASDMLDVPAHAKRFTELNGLITLNPNKPARSTLAFVSAPRYMPGGAKKCWATMQPFLDAVDAEGHPRSSCFWTAPSPGTVALFCRDDYLGDYEGYVLALAAELRHEYEAIAASGVLLQLDAPCLAMSRHTRFSYMTDDEWCSKILRVNVEAINLAVVNIPAHQIRLHVCWGNYPGPHHRDIEASLLWPSLCDLNVKYLLVEMANPRHASDMDAIKAVADRLGDKVIVPGVVDTITPRVEHPRLVAQRLMALAAIVGPSRVMAGPDCGFASTAKSMANTPDVSWLKISALVQGAKLATSLLFDSNAPVSTPFLATTATARVVLVYSPKELARAQYLHTLLTESTTVAHLVMVSTADADPLAAVRWRLDWPVLCVAISAAADETVGTICNYINHQSELPRRPATSLSSEGSIEQLCDAVCARVRDMGSYDKRALSIPLHSTQRLLPERVTVVVVGAGLLGLYAGNKLVQEGFDVIVLDRRAVAGGIWSLYANSTSQVNTSEGGYSVKELLPKESPANKDHSSTKEILGDLEALASQLGSRLRLGVTVNKVNKVSEGEGGGYHLDLTTSDGSSRIIQARGVLMCINDRVGVPRPLDVPMAPGSVQVVPGIADAAQVAGLEWRGKRVVIVGIGAFAVENARTALESGASHVTVVCRRMGTVCPKIIDYANFTADWDENFQHDMKGNAKQFQRWNRLYKQSGAVVPPGWPKQIKPKGQTISVSDIWFVAHKVGKLSTEVGEVKSLEPGAVCLKDGTRIECDVVVPCMGFLRNTDLCVRLTGLKNVCDTNYLDKNMMYLADAEIDDNAFNSFFGSSVLEYGKFFTNVFMEGLRREEELGSALWGPDVPRVAITDRAWSQYITSAKRLVTSDSVINTHARQQVDLRTKQFFKNLPTEAYEAANRQDWEDLHVLLGATPEQRVPYFTDL